MDSPSKFGIRCAPVGGSMDHANLRLALGRISVDLASLHVILVEIRNPVSTSVHFFCFFFFVFAIFENVWSHHFLRMLTISYVNRIGT